MFKLIVTILRGTEAAAPLRSAGGEEMRATAFEAMRRLPRSKRNAITRSAHENRSIWGGLVSS
jgi:hypothetical protein